MKPKPRFHKSSPALALAITMVLQLPQIHAADGTWTATGSGLWSDSTNWSGGVVANGVNSTATFSRKGTQLIILDSSRTIGAISFDSSAYSSQWNIDPLNFNEVLTLAVGTGVPIIAVSNNNWASISATIAGTAGLTKTGYGSTLVLSGTNTYTGTTTIKHGTLSVIGTGKLGNTSNLVIDADTLEGTGGNLDLGATTQTVGSVLVNGTGQKIGSGNLVATSYTIDNSGIDSIGNVGVSSSIDAGLGGLGAQLNKTGSGMTILSGTNAYTGPTTISAGTLQFAQTASLYNSEPLQWTKSNLTVASGASLAINVGGLGEFTASQAKNLLNTLTTSINNNGLKGDSSFAIDTSNSVGDTTFDQVINDSSGLGSGSLGFTKLGSGRLILNQINTNTGATTVNGGTLAIVGSGTLGNHNAISVNDSGTLDLGGTSQTVGNVTLNGGSITNGSLIGTSYTTNSQNSTSNISASLGGMGVGLTVSGGVILSGNNTYTGETTINSGGITVSGVGTLGMGSNLVMNNGFLNLGTTVQTVGTVVFQDTNGSGGISNGTLIGDSFSISNTTGSVSSSISAGLAGTGTNLEKTGIGRISLSGMNSYTGTTTISEGTLRFSNTSSLYGGIQSDWNKQKITVGSGGTIELAVGGTGSFSIAEAKTILTNLSTGVNNNGLQAGSVFSISLTLGGGGNQTFDQVIADSNGVGGGAIGFMNRGLHTLTLNQANTYTGSTIVGGSLAISGAGTLGDHADLVVGGEGLFFGDLNLGGTTQSVGDVTIVSGVVNNGNLVGDSYSVQAGTIRVGLGGTGASFTKGGIAESEAFLSGTNTYTGTTTIASGTLQIERTASLYNSDPARWTKASISVASGATLGLNVAGPGEFSVAQAKSLLANLTTSINNNGFKSGSIFAINTANATEDVTFDQIIANSTGTGGGTLGLTKSGEGKLILNRANTYTGPTSVSGGTLALSGSGTLGNTSMLSISEYGAVDLGGSTQTAGTVSLKGSVSNGNLIATSYQIEYNGTIGVGLQGTGANLTTSDNSHLILSGVNTYTGTTTVGLDSSVHFTKAASLYNGDTSKWTKSNILVGRGTLAVSVGGQGEFSIGQAQTLLGNLTTSINHNGLQAGTFAIDTSNATGDTTFNQVIADPNGNGGYALGFTKLGDHKLILDQTNTYTGQTEVNGGTLVVNGSISTSTQTTVNDLATIAGSGIIGSLVITSGGTVSPGNSAGILRTGDMRIDGTFAAEIFGGTAGTLYDQLNVTGTVSLSGTLAVTMSSYTPSNGRLFFLIDNDYNDAITGTFTGLDPDSTFMMSGQLWKISYNADLFNNSFDGGNDLALMAIPEPGAVLLSAVSMVALLRRNRRSSYSDIISRS